MTVNAEFAGIWEEMIKSHFWYDADLNVLLHSIWGVRIPLLLTDIISTAETVG
jgi:hypothetical protein